MLKKQLLLLFSFLLISPVGFTQQDTIKYQWPYNPMTTQRNVSGTFAEYRSTSENGHYHNGTDIPASAGTPVLAVLPGVVAVAYHDGSTGYNSYVRVTSTINGQSKNITYFHTIPSVSVGQTVQTGQQVSTIAIDHVHLIEYRLGSSLSTGHLNAIRPDGGLVPYIDPWKPHIRSVKFYLDNTNTQLPANSLGSKVDIVVHVEEENGTSASARNNGTYKIGYKILSADMQTVVYNPPDNGLRFQYYNKPGDSYVNVNYYQPASTTSSHVYIVTNGSGASHASSTQTVANNFWNVDNFPYGNYTVMVFTEDVRGNTDTVYVPVTTTDIDLIPPAQPELRYVKKTDTDTLSFSWIKPGDADLKGYRLFYSLNGSTWQLRDNEAVLTNELEFYSYFYNQLSPLYLRLNAVDSAAITNVSDPSDSYGIRMLNDNKKILIVDGFDRYGGSGSWSLPYHNFVISHAQAFNSSFESCSNDQIINGTFNLNDYHLVIWILGDESTSDETFNLTERLKVAAYLESGGKLFVSGSEIAWDLEGASSATPADTEFLRKYLKAKFVADNSNIRGVYGEDSTEFANVAFGYGLISQGSPYNEDYPDVIDTVGGSIPVLKYNGLTTAGIAYTGSFNNSPNTGQLIYLAFPFETINTAAWRSDVMAAAFNYFGLSGPLSVEDKIKVPVSFELLQNYPNPFNPTTNLVFRISQLEYVTLKIYDVLGKEVAVLVNEEKQPGEYQVEFNASHLSSGVYFYTLKAGQFTSTKKLLLLK